MISVPDVEGADGWWFSRCENQRRVQRRNPSVVGAFSLLLTPAKARSEFSQRENSHHLGGIVKMRPSEAI